MILGHGKYQENDPLANLPTKQQANPTLRYNRIKPSKAPTNKQTDEAKTTSKQNQFAKSPQKKQRTNRNCQTETNHDRNTIKLPTIKFTTYHDLLKKSRLFLNNRPYIVRPFISRKLSKKAPRLRKRNLGVHHMQVVTLDWPQTAPLGLSKVGNFQKLRSGKETQLNSFLEKFLLPPRKDP